MCVVFRRYKDVSSKNPASGVDPRRIATWARRQGVLSLGHVSLHKQRKVCSRAGGGRKPLILILILVAVALAVAVAVAVAARARARARAFTPLRGASYFSLLVQRKDNQKRCFSTAEWLVKHTLPTRPPRCAARVHSASGIFRHDIPVVAKNDVHPCTSPFGFFPLAPSLRKGPGKSKSKATATATAMATAKATPPLASGKGREPKLHLELSCTWPREAIERYSVAQQTNKSGVTASHRHDLQSTEHRNAARLFSR